MLLTGKGRGIVASMHGFVLPDRRTVTSALLLLAGCAGGALSAVRLIPSTSSETRKALPPCPAPEASPVLPAVSSGAFRALSVCVTVKWKELFSSQFQRVFR